MVEEETKYADDLLLLLIIINDHFSPSADKQTKQQTTHNIILFAM